MAKVLDMSAILEDNISWDISPVRRGHRHLLTLIDSPTRILYEPPPAKAWYPQVCAAH